MDVASSRCYQGRGATYLCVGQTNEIRDSPQFEFRLLEKEIVMGNESLLPIYCLDQSAVIDFPQPQTERIRASISFPHRVGDLERVPHHDKGFKFRQQLLPERQSQAIAGVFPAPHTCGIKSFDQQPRFQMQRIQSRARKALVSSRRQIPGPTKLMQQFIVECHKSQVFPETIRVIGLRRHQFVLCAQVESAGVQ